MASHQKEGGGKVRSAFFLLSFISLLIILPTLVDAYGIAISPATVDVCVIPSEVSTVTFYVSKSADVTQGQIYVAVDNISWAYTQQYIPLPEGTKQNKINVTIIAPQSIDYGVRQGKVIVCAPPTSDFGNSIQPCVESILKIDVEETCPGIEAKKNFWKDNIKMILLASILVLTLAFIYRKVSKMKKKPKTTKKRKK